MVDVQLDVCAGVARGAVWMSSEGKRERQIVVRSQPEWCVMRSRQMCV